jgi:MerR family mercuric resistance operon transcriptional regulator
MSSLTISELARSASVGVETVRYYQRRKLLRDPRPQRSAVNGIRHYDDEDARRLRFIRLAQAAGFTLEQIGLLLELDSSRDRPRARAMASERLRALDAQIAELKRARRALAALASECAASEQGPCPIIASFESAAG